MKRNGIILSFLMVFSVLGYSQSYQKTNLGVKAKIDSTDVEIQF